MGLKPKRGLIREAAPSESREPRFAHKHVGGCWQTDQEGQLEDLPVQGPWPVEDLKKSGSKALVVAKDGGTYKVIQQRVDISFDKGSLDLFLWIPDVEDEELAILELVEAKLTIPCFGIWCGRRECLLSAFLGGEALNVEMKPFEAVSCRVPSFSGIHAWECAAERRAQVLARFVGRKKREAAVPGSVGL